MTLVVLGALILVGTYLITRRSQPPQHMSNEWVIGEHKRENRDLRRKQA